MGKVINKIPFSSSIPDKHRASSIQAYITFAVLLTGNRSITRGRGIQERLKDLRVERGLKLEELADTEIYVDGMAAMRFHDMNSSLAALRAMILENNPEAAEDRSLRILEACQIGEEDFFCHVTHKT